MRHDDTLVLSGAIADTAGLVGLVKQASGGKLVLDLHGITFINSLGVRDWVHMQSAAAKAGVRLILRRVSEPLIHQLNIVPAARAASDIESFYAGYMCEHCGEEHSMLLDTETHRPQLEIMQPPSLSCPSCTKGLTFIDPAELYFSFVAGTSPLR
ncbi:MAG: hypothetical protein H0T46_34720 [Deltaproteobacteria bacterium]|nr:hypothetical protein [Deltaproteobacteria bacterium]